MSVPKWDKPLSEVLLHDTQKVKLVSERTGNEYETDIIDSLPVVSTGVINEVKGKYKYSVVDTSNNLEYSIKAPNKLDGLKFGTVLIFNRVRGGRLNNGLGWYSADSVEVYKKE